MRTFLLLGLVGCGTTVHPPPETADTAPPTDCSCEGVALLLVTVVDPEGAPVSPSSASVVQDDAPSTAMFCTDNQCRHLIYGYTNAPIQFDVTVNLADVSESYEIVVDGSLIDAESGCDCKSWADDREVVWDPT